MKVISVNITKGGCCKTTTVQVLAEILGKDYGKKVLVIDTDPQANLTTVSGVDVMNCQNYNLYTLLKEKSTLAETIKECSYYDIIPGSLLLACADVEFNMLGREFLIKDLVSQVEKFYDYVLIDTPPALGILNIMSLSASDAIIIPTEPSFLAMVGLEQLFETIRSVKKRANTTLEIAGILMVKYNNRANINQAVVNSLEDMAKHMGTKVLGNRIRETVKIREAQSQRKPVIEWDNKCSAVEDYTELVKELMPELIK